MKRLLLALAAVAGCSRAPAVQQPPEVEHSAVSVEQEPAAPIEAADDETEKRDRRLAKLLRDRLDGGMDYSFAQFANMFLVQSRISLREGIALMTPVHEVAEKTLQSPFPAFYRPTVREFLDAIALQTSTEWKSDPSGKYIDSDVPDAKIDGPMVFEFLPVKREKPFEVTLPAGWKSEDRGQWLMLIPPDFPVGLDIYERGVYSADDQADERKLLDKVPVEVALEWVKRIKEKASDEDLKAAKVGDYDALFFEANIPSELGEDLHWRQWTFMVGNRCYFLVSTILPRLDDKIYPDVEKILASFREKK